METDFAAERLAAAFAGGLYQVLSADDWQAMLTRNAVFDTAVCASHDFCDANEVMAGAFVAVMGRDILPDDDSGMTDADVSLWGRAWGIARREYLTAKERA